MLPNVVRRNPSPKSSLALVLISWQREVFAHEGDVTVPGLVETQHADLGILAVSGQERLHLSGNDGSSACHDCRLKLRNT